MALVPITVMGFRCNRCAHEWVPRGDVSNEPKVCPKCKSPYWNTTRKNAPPMSYEEFRDAVQVVLTRMGRAMTWTEIRTEAKLPQSFPNNKWVRRMEGDIGLMRVKDRQGILHWQVVGEKGSDGTDSRP